MRRHGRLAVGLAVAAVFGLGACGGGGGSEGADTQNGSEDASTGDWVVALHEGESATGPGDFRGGEVELSEEAVTQGLEDIESGTVATITGATGETFDGNCFMIRQDDGKYEQLVMCGPFVAADGTVRWLKAGFGLRYEGEEPIGFDDAPSLTTAAGGSRDAPSAEVAETLVRPDGVEPDTTS